MTPPDERLRTFGSVVRTARLARHMTQAQLASAASVSLAQLALFEKGRNVSLLFLLKVSTALDLSISIDGTAQPATTHGGELDFFELVRIADHFAALVDQLRSFATDAVLPPSERSKQLKDAHAVAAFIARNTQDDEGVARLVAAMEMQSSEAAVPRRAKSPASIPKAVKKRARKGEE